ncbi:VCBS repeat-containing protein [Bacteriovoracales bacterium]|nr:VCBS repeat-containing protein [Bacteriovoracales bacterium]
MKYIILILFSTTVLASVKHGNFCLKCHGHVPPTDLPKENWPAVIEQMFRYAGSLETISGKKEDRPDYLRFYNESPYKLDKASIPDLQSVITEYTKKSVPLKKYVEGYPQPDLKLHKSFSKKMLGEKAIPALSHIQYVDWKEEGKTSRRVFMSDMARGGISYFDLDKKTYTQVFKVRHPSHFDIVDLNKDGLMDLVVSDLGMLMTVTTKEGKIYWFENQGKGKFKKHVLAENLGRCADVRAGDFDKDGDIDLIAADFGYMEGKVFLLKNTGEKFEEVLIDGLSGAINAEFVDFNKDGLTDIVAIYSQEHEKIIGYFQKKNGFERKVLADAGNPGWGGSGMTIGDVDKDGDLDILWLNGDTMDNFVVKPNQGLHLLENNKGKLTRKFLGFFPGIHKAKIGDVDNDGDLDIVGVSALFPFGIKPQNIMSVGLFEKTKKGYKVHALEKNNTTHFSVLLHDVDKDKDLDFIVANTAMDGLFPRPDFKPKPSVAPLEIYENKN